MIYFFGYTIPVSNLLLGVMVLALIIWYLDVYFFSAKNQRKKQFNDFRRDSVIKKRIDDSFEKRVSFKSRNKLEKLCLQAGYQVRYADFILLSLFIGAVFGSITGIALNNPFLGIVMAFLGYAAPKQYISIVRNKRMTAFDKQVGSFMTMVVKRYETTNDFAKSLRMTTEEFIGEEPIYSELRKTIVSLDSGLTAIDAMQSLSDRTENKYIAILTNYLRSAQEIGTEEYRVKLLNSAIEQYNDNVLFKSKMKKELAGPIREAYLMVSLIPAMFLFQVVTNKGYLYFITHNTLGKAGVALAALVFVISLWFVGYKISTPIDEAN